MFSQENSHDLGRNGGRAVRSFATSSPCISVNNMLGRSEVMYILQPYRLKFPIRPTFFLQNISPEIRDPPQTFSMSKLFS